MKYELIKKYTSPRGRVYPVGFMFDCTSVKAEAMKRSGYFAYDAKPLKPKVQKKKNKWVEDINNKTDK